jgi:hypothetical protein
MRGQSSAQQAAEGPVSVEEDPAAITEGDVFQDDMFQDRRAAGPRAPDNARDVASTWALFSSPNHSTRGICDLLITNPI